MFTARLVSLVSALPRMGAMDGKEVARSLGLVQKPGSRDQIWNQNGTHNVSPDKIKLPCTMAKPESEVCHTL